MSKHHEKNSYYLLVGVGRRAEDSEAMAISADDPVYLKEALHDFGLFSEEKISPLINEDATKSNVLAKLDFLVESTQAEPADLVIIFFSGHGCKKGDQYYLICRDSKVSDLAGTAIEGSIFVEKLQAIQCDKMLVLLDCCHAQGITDQDLDIPFDESTLLSLKNRVILTACHKTQLSYLSMPVSIFTHAVIEGLGGKFLKEGDKDVNILNLSMDVRERVVALSKEIEQLQQPQLNVFPKSGTVDFNLVHYPNGGPKEIKLLKKKLYPLKSKDGAKEINTNVESIKDVKERGKYNWMIINNIVQNSGDGNYIVQGSTIINGLSEDGLKTILNHISEEGKEKNKTIELLKSVLEKQIDQNSKELLKKVESIKAGNEQEISIMVENLELLLEKLQALTRDQIITSDSLKKFSLKKEIQQTNKEIEETKNRLAALR
jgi:hypothetical protein